MKRSDLRKLVREDGPPHTMVVTAPVSDDDLRSMAPELLAILEPAIKEAGWVLVGAGWKAWAEEHGYVRLDGVDVEALLSAKTEWDDIDYPFDDPYASPLGMMLLVMKSVLAGLEGESTR